MIEFFDEGGDFYRSNYMYKDFVKECFAEDDLKGFFASKLSRTVPGSDEYETSQFNLIRDFTNAFY